MSNLGQEPAFPVKIEDGQGGYEQLYGLTKREEFAKAAMQGLLADHKDHEDERQREWVPCDSSNEAASLRSNGQWERQVFIETCPECVARLAVEHADALIARLERTP